MEIEYSGLIGLYGGAIVGLLGWYFGRKKAKKEHSLDEMHHHIMKTARSFSWFVTLGTIYILFTLYGIGVELHIPAVLGILMLVQMASWGFSGAILKYNLSMGKEINVNVLAGICIIAASTTFFLIIAMMTNNWIFLFWPIPLGMIGSYFIKQGVTANEGGD